MKDAAEILNNSAGEVSVARLVGSVNVELLDGTTAEGVHLVRKEKLADGGDIESIYEREYVAYVGNREVFLGNDKGETITVKERRQHVG